MAAQEDVALSLNEQMVGQTVKVLIDRIEADRYVGRTQWDSPEVDPEVYFPINDTEYDEGDFVMVRLTQAYPYELEGELI